MKRMGGARFALRDATAGSHLRLDSLLSRLDLRRRDDYASFLRAQAPGYMAVETALLTAGASRIVPGWSDRLRSSALAGDIAALGLSPPPPARSPAFQSEAQVLGGLYVLEGSRLGGAMLLRRVPPAFPTTFLTPGNPADWRALVSLIDLKLSSKARLADAVSAARAVFGVFEHSALKELERTDIDA